MSGAVTLYVGAHRVGRAPRNADGRCVEELPYASVEELAERIAELSRGNGRPPRLRVILEQELVQRRTLTDLPAVPARELDALVSHGAARFFRQNGHPLVTAARWREGDPSGERSAQAVAVDATIPDAILSGAGRGGARIEDILSPDAADGFSLLPRGERRRRQRQDWLRLARCAGYTLLLWIGAALVVAGWTAWRTVVVDRELRRLEAPRLALSAARRSMDSAAAMVDSVTVTLAHRATLTTRLNDLIDHLPDSVVLTGLELRRSGSGSLEGRSALAHRVAERLSEAPTFRDVRLLESGGRDSGGGVAWERFVIQLGQEETP